MAALGVTGEAVEAATEAVVAMAPVAATTATAVGAASEGGPPALATNAGRKATGPETVQAEQVLSGAAEMHCHQIFKFLVTWV